MFRRFASRSALTVGMAAGLTIGLVGVAGVAGAVTHGPKIPGKPTAVTVVPSNTAFTVSWGVPATDGGASITDYTVTAAAAGQATETCTSSSALTCEITGIVNPVGKAKNKYKVSVTATNAIGTSKAAKASGTFIGTDANNCSNLVPYANLSGCDLSLSTIGYFANGTDLTRANLQDANISRQNLTGSYVTLVGANLVGANIMGANFTNMDFTGANLTGEDLTTATYGGGNNYTNAVLTNTNLAGLNMATDTLTGVVSGGIATTVPACESYTPAQFIAANGEASSYLTPDARGGGRVCRTIQAIHHVPQSIGRRRLCCKHLLLLRITAELPHPSVRNHRSPWALSGLDDR